ncbi:MAG: CoA transferase [Pseudomonadota bacterium]
MFDQSFIVLELANILAGPITGMGFAELGARVIKLENPATGGDATRGFKLSSEDRDSDICAYYSCANWGKESLTVNFSTAAGKQVAHALAAKADIVIASFKPGDAEKLALDFDTLKALNERLIYGQISAYGPQDPRPGFDAILQAETGFTSLNGDAEGPPTKMPVALIDILASHQLKEGLLLALLNRERTGEGGLVDVSLFQAGIASLANQATNYLVGGIIPQRMGSEHPNIVPYGSVIESQDGRQIVIAAATERQFRELVRALDRHDLADDPTLQTGPQRVENRDKLLAAIRAAAAVYSAQEIAARLQNAKVPFGFVNDMAQVFELQGAQDLLLESDSQQGLTGVRTLAVNSAQVDFKSLAAPPALNQNFAAIIEGFLGYTGEEINLLRDAGAFS